MFYADVNHDLFMVIGDQLIRCGKTFIRWSCNKFGYLQKELDEAQKKLEFLLVIMMLCWRLDCWRKKWIHYCSVKRCIGDNDLGQNGLLSMIVTVDMMCFFKLTKKQSNRINDNIRKLRLWLVF